MLKKIEEKQVHLVILAAVVLVVFFGSFVLIGKNGIQLSPDEKANAFFTERFAQTRTLSVLEPLNIEFDDALHPRSTVSIDGRIVPGSFIGLPVLYGSLAAVIGSWIVPFLTLIIAALGVFAYYAIAKKLFNQNIAFISSLLLAIHPGWWYYAARSLMHNVLFLSLLIFAAYFMLVRPLRQRKSKIAWLPELDIVLSGLFLGGAIFVRASEIVWIGLVLIFLAIVYRSKITVRASVLFIIAIIIALIPMFDLNRSTYGSPVAIGYTIEDGNDQADFIPAILATPATPETPATLRQSIEQTLKPFFPFGIHPRAIWRNFNHYAITIFWWLAVLILIGIPLFYPERKISKDERKIRKVYLAVFGFVSLWLVVLYGSWVIHDNPDPAAVTIANSYVRYWLPMYLLAMPLAAYAIDWISQRARTKSAQKLIIAALLVLSFGLSVRLVYFSKDDGLVDASKTLQRSVEIKTQVFSQTEPDSVIIVDHADKLFFPDRRVLQPLRSERTYQLMPRIIEQVPLYYYGITFPQKDVIYLNTEKLKGLGLRIDLIETFDEESLYKITES